MIQNPLERENIIESMDTNKIFILEINMRKIDVIPFTKIVCMPEQFLEARIQQPRNQAIMEYLTRWKNFITEDETCEYYSFI